MKRKPIRAVVAELAAATYIGLQVVETVWLITEAIAARRAREAAAADDAPPVADPIPTPEPPREDTPDE